MCITEPIKNINTQKSDVIRAYIEYDKKYRFATGLYKLK